MNVKINKASLVLAKEAGRRDKVIVVTKGVIDFILTNWHSVSNRLRKCVVILSKGVWCTFQEVVRSIWSGRILPLKMTFSESSSEPKIIKSVYIGRLVAVAIVGSIKAIKVLIEKKAYVPFGIVGALWVVSGSSLILDALLLSGVTICPVFLVCGIAKVKDFEGLKQKVFGHQDKNKKEN